VDLVTKETLAPVSKRKLALFFLSKVRLMCGRAAVMGTLGSRAAACAYEGENILWLSLIEGSAEET
jgi:hypothetical protein